MHRPFFLVLLILISGSILGQQYVDLVKIGYHNTPINQFDTLTNGTRIQESNLDFLLPVVLDSNYTLLVGGFAEKLSSKTDPTRNNLTEVYSTLLKLGVQIKISKNWKSTWVALPKYASDFKGKINARDFQLGGLVQFKRTLSRRKNFSFGLYANDELFGPFFVPLLGFYYTNPSQRLEINTNLPLFFDLNYQSLRWLKTGLRFNAMVRSYNLHNPVYQPNGEYLNKSTNELSTYLSFSLTHSVLLETLVGYSIGRNYRIYDIKDQITWGLSAFRFGDTRNQLNYDFKDGLVFNVRLVYRFHLNPS